MDINLPDVLAEVTAAFDRYEERWSPTTSRCSTSCSGTARTRCATASPRTSTATTPSRPSAPARPAQGLERDVLQDRDHHLRPRLRHRQLEFQRDGSAKTGRQSQTWMRTPEGWRVVAAHVSLLRAATVARFLLHPILYPHRRDTMSISHFNRRDSLKSLAALGAAGTLGGWSALAGAQKPHHRRRDLRRPARRLRLQPGAGRGRGRAQEAARREGGRRRERARDRRRAEDHDRHDRAGRRHAAVPHLVRLLRSAHAGGGAEESRTCASRIAAACGPKASTRRTPAATSATSTSAST